MVFNYVEVFSGNERGGGHVWLEIIFVGGHIGLYNF